jgi:hypothetical protein
VADNDEPATKKRRGGDHGRDWVCDFEGCMKDFKSVFPSSQCLFHAHKCGSNRKRRSRPITTFRTSTNAISRAPTRTATSLTVTNIFSRGTLHKHTDRQSRPIVPAIQRTARRRASRWESTVLRGGPIWRGIPRSGGPYAVHIPIFPRRSRPAEIRSYRPSIPWFPANTCSGELTTCGGTCYLNMVWSSRRRLWTDGWGPAQVNIRKAVGCDDVTRVVA